MSEVAPTEVEKLEKQLADAQALIARADMAERLAKIPEFKKLILEDFCTTECARHAQNYENPALDMQARQDSLAMAGAAGHLRRYLQVVIQMAAPYRGDILPLQQAIEEARAEEGGE